MQRTNTQKNESGTGTPSGAIPPIVANRGNAPGVRPRAWLRAARVLMGAKASPQRPPVLCDVAQFGTPDFTYDTTALEEVERRLLASPADEHGMRWIHGRDRVLFHVERDLHVPFDDLTSRVDIRDVGLMFQDVLGIETEVVSRDDQGRPALQMQRIVALAQPRYSTFLGKDELDVYKLERIDYDPDEHRFWMFAVGSPNGSTICDDGYMAFVRGPGGGARLRFVACQTFPTPRVLAAAGIDKLSSLKERLTERAYRRFFNDTIDNILAAYEGREYGITRRSA